MKVPFNRSVGLFVVALQGQEIVAPLALDLASNGRLASHRIDGHNKAFDGEQLEQFWNGRNLIGLGISFDLAYNEATVIGTPRREHVQGGGRCGAVKGGFHRFAIKGDQCTLRELRDGAGPGQKAFLKALRIEARKEAAKGVMGRDPVAPLRKG